MAVGRYSFVCRCTVRRDAGPIGASQGRYSSPSPAGIPSLTPFAQPILTLNPFLSPHVSTLLQRINTRAVVQYIRPFSSVSLTSMSAATGMPEDSLLFEVEQLIESGQIKGKIDLIDNVRRARFWFMISR